MAEYRKTEAREWAREKMRGVANVIIPTFTQDLRDVNEAATRHDVRKEIEYGFWGTLLVSETATTFDEYRRFSEWAVDEARGRLHLIHHASWNTLEESIRAAQVAEATGVDLILLSYPPTFYPQSQEEIFEYTKAYCDATNLGVILFPVPLWGFERLHPAGIAPETIARMVREIPNIVAIKSEGGMPTIAGFVENYKRFSNEVIVTFPMEDQALMLASLVSMPFMGTSNYEYYGPMIPRIFTLIQEGRFEEAMKLYWQIHPARLVNQQQNVIPGANFIHRMLWKYQGWLNGFNGGPLRAPTMRLNGNQMRALRQGLVAAGLQPTNDGDDLFFEGRNPA
ncbi:MAG: dihydrodipicolinate synthase family protein [Firmicutes bacterium]|nr:dihydrodipicolinate synthase family protein [Bacillota bacterium]